MKLPEPSSTNNRSRDPDLAAAEVAMRRAAQIARERAERIGTRPVVLQDGDPEEKCAMDSERNSEAP